MNIRLAEIEEKIEYNPDLDYDYKYGSDTESQEIESQKIEPQKIEPQKIESSKKLAEKNPKK